MNWLGRIFYTVLSMSGMMLFFGTFGFAASFWYEKSGKEIYEMGMVACISAESLPGCIIKPNLFF